MLVHIKKTEVRTGSWELGIKQTTLITGSLFILSSQLVALGSEVEHSVSPWQVIVGSNLLNVIILAIAIIYLGNRFLPQIIDQRKKQISKELEEAQNARIKAVQELENIQEKTKNISCEVEELKEEARITSLSIKKQVEQNTEKELESLRQKVKREISSSYDEAIQEIKKTTSTQAINLAEEALKKLSNNKEIQERLIKDFLAEIK